MTRLLAVLVAGLVLVGTLGSTLPAAAQTREVTWRYLLDRAAQAAEENAYTGEVLWVTYGGGDPDVATFLVRSSGNGEIEVTDRGRYDVRLGDISSGLADYERGWYVPLPAADLSRAHRGLSRLETKYLVDIVGPDALLDRPTTRVEIRRRDDRSLAERLWVDDASGLLLRREMYDGDNRLLRMAAYLRLDLNPISLNAIDVPPPPRSTVRRQPVVEEVDETEREVLQASGWVVPDALPGGYLPDASFAVSAENSEPLHMVFGDGLYTVSLFEQAGVVDSSTLPEGAEITEVLGFRAHSWPGAVPQRYVWEASGRTFSLVGDAPPRDLAAIAAALPQPEPLSFFERLRRGLSRLWSWVSPWD